MATAVQQTSAGGWPMAAKGSAILAGGCALLYFWQGAGEEAARACIRATALWSVLYLLAIVPASALHRRYRSPRTRWLMLNRRYLGLQLAASHALHLAFILLLYARGELGEVGVTTLYGGGWGYVLLFAMALTSNDASLRALGSAWRQLHRLGLNTLWVIFTLSYLPQSDSPPTRWVIFLGLLAVMAIRWWPVPKRVPAHS